MRGTASLLRAISTRRQKRETQEIHRIREEHMEPIGENEAVEWDGLRRRRTLSTPGSSPNIQRRKTIHPPLGMSHFPTDDDEDGPEGMHPGFWTHFKRKPVSSGSDIEPNNASLPMDNLKSEGVLQDEYGRGVSPHPSSNRGSHNFGLPSALRHVQTSNGSDYFGEDTTYRGADGSHPISPNDGHVHFAPGSISAPQLAQGRARGDSLGSPQGSPPTAARSTIGLPRSPRDGARRQFSFQNVFHRSRSPHNASAPEQLTRVPMSRSGLSFTRRSPSSATSRADGTGGTEEERLGLVRGDTHNGSERAPGYDSRRGSQASTENGANSPPRYDSAGGTVVRRPPNQRRDSDEDDAPQGADAKELESGAGAHGRSFI
jgi:magnesium transporter